MTNASKEGRLRNLTLHMLFQQNQTFPFGGILNSISVFMKFANIAHGGVLKSHW